MYPSIEENFLFKEVLSPMAFLNETGLKLFLQNCDNRYLKKNGGGHVVDTTNGTGSICKVRDYATIFKNPANPSAGSWAAVYTGKTKNGVWSLSTIPSSYDALYLTYKTDADYTKGYDGTDHNFWFGIDGSYSGSASSAVNVTGTVGLDHGGTGANTRAAARKNLGIQADTNAAPGSGYDPYTIWVQF